MRRGGGLESSMEGSKRVEIWNNVNGGEIEGMRNKLLTGIFRKVYIQGMYWGRHARWWRGERLLLLHHRHDEGKTIASSDFQLKFLSRKIKVFDEPNIPLRDSISKIKCASLV